MQIISVKLETVYRWVRASPSGMGHEIPVADVYAATFADGIKRYDYPLPEAWAPFLEKAK